MMESRSTAVGKASAPVLIAVGGLVAYAVRLKLHPVEIVRALIGLTVLWGPMAALVYVTIRREVVQRIPRLTFALIASYALTTLLYFACCVIWSQWIFYILLCLIAASSIYLVVRGGANSLWRNRPAIRFDWVLIFLIITSLFLFARYQVPYKTDAKTGRVRIVACLEQTYFVGQAYELARHTPPLQQACQAGVPERAYHLLPHLAAMLIARFAGQSDIMHAHLVYHYAMLTIMMCLGLYSIAERLAAARAAGYIATCLLVIFAIPFHAIGSHPLGYLYFNFFPLASSLLEPVVVTSPQMYSGLAITFGIFLGVLLMCRQLTSNDAWRGRCGWLAIFTAMMVAAMSRFRVQVFIPLLPGFLLVLVYFWRRSRSRMAITLAALLAVVISGLLFLETHWAGYLHGTATVHIRFAPADRAFIDAWPFSDQVVAGLRWFLSGPGYALIWPSIATLGFCFFTAIGLPIFFASIWCLVQRRGWREWGGYAFLVIFVVAASLVGSQMIQVGYDSYSVGGQMLLHLGWYLLPFLALAVWQLVNWMMGRSIRRRKVFAAVGICLVAMAVVIQLRRSPSDLDRMVQKLSVALPHNDWLSVQYLHDHTPRSAVILSDHHLEPSTAVYPGIAGRAAYIAYVHGTLELLPHDEKDGLPPGRSRLDIIKELWATRSADRFIELMSQTHVTHLVEFSDHPLNIGPRKFLRPVWESPGGSLRVRILQYAPQFRSAAAADDGAATAATTQHSLQGSGP